MLRCAAFVLVLVMAAALPVVAQSSKLGVVLMHGKQGRPDFAIVRLAQAIEQAGFPVERPTMCWSATRIYDRTLPDCMTDVDAAIERLRKRGATAFVVAGHSLGGLGAILYGSLPHDGLKGIVALAPAPGPRVENNPVLVASVQKARALIVAGHGDDRAVFNDTNNGPRGVVTFEVRTTANIFVSFHDMSGPANLVTDTSDLEVPLLWVSGTEDPSQIPRAGAFDRAPPNPQSRYLQVNARHMDTPDAAGDAVVTWLKGLAF